MYYIYTTSTSRKNLRLYNFSGYNHSMFFYGLSGLNAENRRFLGMIFKQSNSSNVGQIDNIWGQFYETIDFGPDNDKGSIYFYNCVTHAGLYFISSFDFSYELLDPSEPET